MRTVSPRTSVPAKGKRSHVSSGLAAKAPLDRVKQLLTYFVKDTQLLQKKLENPRINGLLLDVQGAGKVSLAASAHSFDS